MFSQFFQKCKVVALLEEKSNIIKEEEQVGKFKMVDFHPTYLVTGKVQYRFGNLPRRPLHQYIH